MKKKEIKKSPSAIIVAAVAVIAAVAVTLTMFFSDVEVKRLFEVSNFKAEGVVYFEGSAPITAKGPISVNYDDEDAANYIGKLRVDVDYTGCGTSFIRVRIVEEWSTTNNNVKTVIPYSNRLPYEFGSLYSNSDSGNKQKWYDNRSVDSCFYFAAPVVSTGDNVTSTIPLITGFNSDDVDIGAIASGTDLNIVVEVEAVQVNRYPQFWSLTRLPWTNGSSNDRQEIAAA